MMDRSFSRSLQHAATVVMVLMACTTTGCLHSILATGIFLWQGGNVIPAECDALKGERVIVICRPPSTNEFRYAGAARSLGKRISELLQQNVKGIDVVSPREVDNWVDEQDWDNIKDLGRAVNASKIVYIELGNFELYKGTTLYQGNADVHITVYDMKDKGKNIWERNVGQILFPRNSGIPAADKPLQAFQHQFVEVIAHQSASYFYKHDPNALFALDAIANQ